MSLVEWNPFRELERDMGSILDRTPFRYLSNANSPRVDVYQTENDVILKAEIPGVSKEDINVYVDENTIRISGETKKNEELKDENIYRSERYYGRFSRTIPLPVEIKSDNVRADYTDGILTVVAQRAESSKSKGKKIDIQ